MNYKRYFQLIIILILGLFLITAHGEELDEKGGETASQITLSRINAVTIPTISDNLTVVNLRKGSGVEFERISTVSMYENLYVEYEENDFYFVTASCTDNGVRQGYISKSYVQKFENLGTGYIRPPSDSPYDMSYCKLLRYPYSKADLRKKLNINENLNVLYKKDGWYYCEKDGIYGYVPAPRLELGWTQSEKLSNADKNKADKIINTSMIFSANDRTMLFSGQETEVEEPVIFYYGTTMIPIKNISDCFGGSLNWNGDKKLAEVKIGLVSIKFTINSDIAYVGGKKVKMTSSAIIKNGRTYVPIRTIADSIDKNLYYFGEGMPMIITEGKINLTMGQYILDKVKKSFFKNDEYLNWPVPSSSGISSGYGDGRGHKSIDITGEADCSVVASQSGVITEVFSDCTHDYAKTTSCYCGGNYGNYVVITHEHTLNGQSAQTRYSHLSRVNVTVGQVVSANDIVGFMGSTGRSTGTHLDFELSLDGVKTDPGGYLIIPSDIYDSGNTPLYTQPYIDKLLETQPTF